MGIYELIERNPFFAKSIGEAPSAPLPDESTVFTPDHALKILKHLGCRECDAYVKDAELNWCNAEPDHYRNVLVMDQCPRRTCLYCATLAGCKRARDLEQTACMKFQRMGNATGPVTVIELGAPKRQSA